MEKQKEIFQALQDLALNNAFCQYSNFHVAAIVETNDGKLYDGVNVENVSFGGTICAERSAILNYIMNDKNKADKIKTIYIYAYNGASPERDSKKFVPPCGICRQFISEFSDAKRPIHIVLFNDFGETKEKTLDELLPERFASL